MFVLPPTASSFYVVGGFLMGDHPRPNIRWECDNVSNIHVSDFKKLRPDTHHKRANRGGSKFRRLTFAMRHLCVRVLKTMREFAPTLYLNKAKKRSS